MVSAAPLITGSSLRHLPKANKKKFFFFKKRGGLSLEARVLRAPKMASEPYLRTTVLYDYCSCVMFALTDMDIVVKSSVGVAATAPSTVS